MIVQFAIKKSTLTADEKEFLRKYHALDESGKRKIQDAIVSCLPRQKNEEECIWRIVLNAERRM